MENRCPTCRTPFAGAFCHECGEKKLEPSDLHVSHYVGGLINAFTFADNKLWRTLSLLIGRPGMLTTYYMQGRRTAYIRPLQLFFMANLLYFIFPIFQTFNTNLEVQMNGMPLSAWNTRLVNAHLDQSGITLAEYAIAYNHTSTNTAKLLLVVLVFFFGLQLALIQYDKRQLLAGHISIAFETMTFNLLVNSLFLGLLTVLVIQLSRALGTGWSAYIHDGSLTILLIGINTWLFWQMDRNYYHRRKWEWLWRVPLQIIALFVALTAYRSLLFFITFWLV